MASLSKKEQRVRNKILTVARKKNIFTFSELVVLTEQNKIHLTTTLEKMVKKNELKVDNDTYTYIPPKPKVVKKDSEDKLFEPSLIKTLPFKVTKPKEIYLRHINEMEGFQDYFFATQNKKDRVIKILTLLKEAHGLKDAKLEKVLKKHKVTKNVYNSYKLDIERNGLKSILGSVHAYRREPMEIFYFFKEYYLTPKKLTSEEARELAIRKLERITGVRFNREYITDARKYYKWMKLEYTNEQIQKFRNVNFSEFDVENMYHE